MKRTKKITAFLKAISKDLPKQEYQFLSTISEKGEDLIQKGLDKDGDGFPIMPHKNYVKKIPQKNLVNHENRLKSAFDSNGFEGVKTYLTPFVKIELRKEFFEKLNKTLV